MARMKSRSQFPPGGWIFVQPQISNAVIGGPSTSFDACVNAVLSLRQANPWITQKSELSLDRGYIEMEVDEYNAARCLAQPGWEIFVQDTSLPKAWSPSTSQRLRRSEGVVAGARKTVAGVRMVAEWLGSGLKPVDGKKAEGRALVCLTCPENDDPNWIQRVDAAVAADIKTLVEIKNDLKLTTPHDEHLNTCKLCDCYLKLKVHTPIEHIQSGTKPEMLQKMAKVRNQAGNRCWVVDEIKA